MVLVAAVFGYLAVAFLWPVWRGWRQTGVFPVVFHRRAAPQQRAVGAGMAAALLGIVTLVIVRALLGPAVVGEWRVPLAISLTGWFLLASGWAVTIAAQHDMRSSWRVGIDDRPTALVTAGLFALVRNPIFSAMLLALAGVALIAPSPWSLGLWAAAWILVRLQVHFEEQHLQRMHGDAYRDYARGVGRFVPYVGRLRATS